MLWDDISVLILYHIYNSSIKEKKSISTWEIAKKMYLNKEGNFLNSRCVLIERRLRRMSKEEFVKIDLTPEGKIFTILSNKIKFYEKHRFDNKYKKAILIKEKNGDIIFEIKAGDIP